MTIKTNNQEVKMPKRFYDDLGTLGDQSFYVEAQYMPEEIKNLLRAEAELDEIQEKEVIEEIYYISVSIDEKNVECPSFTGVNVGAIYCLSNEYGGEQRDPMIPVRLSSEEWKTMLVWIAMVNCSH